MNKQLLSFTALVAVGVLGASGTAVAQKASKPTISIGGYMSQGVRFVDNADAVGGRDTGGFAAWQDSEIFFKISGMLDNGISIGGGWEMEGTSEDGVSATSGFIDEARVWLRGGFGELRLGQDDGAGQLMTTGYMGSWATQNGLNLSFDKSELVPAPTGYNNSGPAFTTRVDLADSDHTKVTYITPRFGGFQLGGSYARDLAPGADVEIDQSTTLANQDFYVVAANFDRKFGNFRLGVGVAYATMDAPADSGGGNVVSSSDPRQIGGGVLLEFGPVRVAGGWNVTKDFRRSAATSNEGSSYDIGVRYSFGAHRIGLAYMGAETDAAVATVGQDEHSVLWGTHSMTLGPGVAWRNTLEWADWDGEGTAATADNDGWGVATEIALSF